LLKNAKPDLEIFSQKWSERMDFTSCVQGRRSIRKFKAQRVDRGIIEKIVHTASFSPSWKNSQVVRYILVEEKEKLKFIAENCLLGFERNAPTILNAPALILVMVISGRSGYERDGSFSTGKEDRWEVFDAGIATQTFCLAAYNEGLGTVIMGYFDEKEVSKVVNLPEGQKLAAMVAIGVPEENPEMPKRKTVEDLLTYG
jgi:nitroreductase